MQNQLLLALNLFYAVMLFWTLFTEFTAQKVRFHLNLDIVLTFASDYQQKHTQPHRTMDNWP